MEVESDSNKVVVEEGDNVIVPTPSFLVNSDIIESVQIENQSEELRALGLTVYDQSKFEEGILKQVDAALEEQEKLQSLKKKPVTGKQNRKKIFDDVAPNKVQNETEKEKLVRLGQMTPFGTMLTGTKITSQELTSFEKYLLEQEKLRNLKSQHTSKKGKSLKSPTASKEKVVHVLEPTSTTSKSNLTKKKKKNSKQFPDTSSSRKRKSSKDDEEEWNTDDSDWEYSDEETPSKKKKKRKNQADKVIDDGNVEDYQQRLRDWELDDAIDCEEFEGGLKIPSMIWDQLYNYQKVGIRWMYELRLQRCGGILGDEMGLGKTIQIVAFLAALSHSKILNRLSTYRGLGPVLLVAPATVMHQWVKEIHKWWPPLRVAIMHESGSYDGTKNALIKSINKANGIIITSYAGVVQNSEQLLALDWDYVILDEGHKIRNPDAQATLVVKQFRTCNRFILSGSPMQNNLKELWSLFDFVFPGKLGTLPVFMQNFSIPITQGGYSNASQVEVATAFKCATVLKETINPYLLRRMKADVKDHLKLPEKNEQVLFCRLTPEQRAMYQAYLDSGEIKSIIEGRLQIFIGLTNLRKICNHPDLFQKNGNEDASNPRAYIESSGKLLVVDSLLKIWKEQNHRVLLFSQSRQMLDIMETFVKQHNYSYLRLDGNTGIGSRQPMIQKFNTNPDIFVFLLTTKVGGLGVNLTGANRVVIYDPDWNPSTDLQARERAWRIGQKKDVTVYRLLMSGTIEEKIYHRQIFKQYLTNRVLNDPKQRRFFKSNDLHELFTLKETNNQLTETEAIFAGTESEVATNPYEVPETNKSSKLDKANEDDWMRQWKKKRDEREAEWNKSLEKKKRKEEIKSLNETEEQRRKRKKKEAKEKKKKKQIKVDGEKVKHVVKVSSYCPAVDLDNESAQSSSNQDDYVLQRLFAKTGVMSALRHDSIVDAGNPDYALVEGEAERVAKEAIKELKNSRRNCWGADSGVPTWTGLNGAVRAPDMAEPSIPKPRFGLKKKNVNPAPTITPSTSILKSVEAETPTTSQPESVESVPNSWNSTAFSSQDLLNRMAKRNRLLGLPKASDDEDSNSTFQSTNEEESLILNTQTSPLEFAPEVDFRTMMDDIRNFVAFRGVNPGQVFTDDLLAEFNDKMPSRGAPLFRALLSQLCTFTRDVHNRGIWQLKPKFQ